MQHVRKFRRQPELRLRIILSFIYTPIDRERNLPPERYTPDPLFRQPIASAFSKDVGTCTHLHLVNYTVIAYEAIESTLPKFACICMILISIKRALSIMTHHIS